MKRIRVMIVEDSAVVSEHLRRIISADPRLEVAAALPTAEDALLQLERVAPDVISLDIHLPGMHGFEAIRRIMNLRPTPIVIVSGVDTPDVDLTMQALKAGALSVVEKPVAATHQSYAALANRLCTQLAIMSEVKVLRQRASNAEAPEPATRPLRPRDGYRVMGIAASTGGPNALAQVLTGCGTGFPLPIVAVQHMTRGFVEGFGTWLASATPFQVCIVNRRMPLTSGTVFLAPADTHIMANQRSVWPDDGEPVGQHRPSADVLFFSISHHLGPAAIGVLLTGMGEDGARGLRSLRDSGAYTIAEDESTAIVYGMPAAAVRAGGVCESLPLGKIPGRLRQIVEKR